MSDIAIQTGFWTNWNENRSLGLKLTLGAEAGTYLTNFLAVFINVVLAEFFTKVLCWVVHTIRSSSEPQDAFHHEGQVLLASGSTAFQCATKAVELTCAWWCKKNRKHRLCAISLSILCIFYAVGIISASIFISAKVTSTGGLVLVQPNHCGWPPHDHDEKNLTRGLALYIPGIRIYRNALSYAQKCYGHTEVPNGASCSSFITPRIQRTLKRNVHCPFSIDTCKSEAISLDSGLISSHEHLGINAPPQDRIQFRKKLICSVLRTDTPKFSTGWVGNSTELRNTLNGTASAPGVDFDIYKYGDQYISGIPAPYTFYVTNVTSPRTGFRTQVFSNSTSEKVDKYSFAPRDEIYKEDSLVFLWILENQVVYTPEAVNDSWFQATKSIGTDENPAYKADNPASIMGCVEQYQFCNPDTRCTNHLSIPVREEYFPGLGELEFNARQLATFKFLRRAALSGRSYLPAMFLGDAVLRATEQVFQDPIYGPSGISVSVPNDQWVTEVDSLFNTSLAFLQHMAVEHVSESNLRITPDRTLWDFIEPETWEHADYVCRNQMVRSTVHITLSVVGFACILGIGVLLMILTFSIPAFVPWAYRVIFARSNWYPNKEWRANHPWRIYLSGLEAVRQLQKIHLPGQAPVRPLGSRNNDRTWKERIQWLVPSNPEAVFPHPWLQPASLGTASGRENFVHVRAADIAATSPTEGRNIDIERENGPQAAIPTESNLLCELPENHPFVAVEDQRSMHSTNVSLHHLSADGAGTSLSGGDGQRSGWE